MPRKEKPVLIVGRTSPLSREYTVNTRKGGKAFRDPDKKDERSVEKDSGKNRKGEIRRKRETDPRDIVRSGM